MSITELHAALDVVRAHLRDAHRTVTAARERLDEAHAVLADVGRTHPEPLSPPELAQARAQLDEVLGRIAETVAAVDAYASRL